MLVPRKRARSAEYIVDKVRRRTTSAEVRTSKWKVACCCTLSCTYTKHPTGIVVEYAIDQISFCYSYVGEDLEHILTLWVHFTRILEWWFYTGSVIQYKKELAPVKARLENSIKLFAETLPLILTTGRPIALSIWSDTSPVRTTIHSRVHLFDSAKSEKGKRCSVWVPIDDIIYSMLRKHVTWEISE